MTRLTTVQAAHSYGVLDAQVIERRDTRFVEGSLSDGRNIIVKPQGGYTARGGTTDYGRARRKLTAVTVSAGMLSAPNGGTASYLLDDGNNFVTSAAAGSAFVVFECDFGGATLMHFIDVMEIRAGTSGGDAAMFAQYWDGAAWQDFGNRLKLTIGAQSRRFASGPPGHGGHTATKFRLCTNASLMAGTVTLDRIAVWAESATISDGVVRRYAPEQGTAHQLVITDRNADIFLAGVWQAAAPLPAVEAILREVKIEAKFDTVLAFQRTLEPQLLYRMADSAEWACGPVGFTNLPNVDYGEVYGNIVNEVQEIAFYTFANGDKFELTLEGLTTAAIEYSSTGSTTAANVKAALEALANVNAGLTVNAATANLITVTFTGSGNSGVDWAQMSAAALGGNGYVRARTTTAGDPGGEPIISAARGWPAVGRFVQQRLVMAGLKSRPNDILASVLGDPYNINTKIDASIAAMSFEIDAPENNAIRDMVSAQTLVFLGSQQAAFLKSGGLSADEAPVFGQSDAPGVKAAVPVVTSGNGIYYVQDGGETQQLMAYSELEQNFVPDNAGVLSASLIRDPVDQSRRRPADGVDADLIILPNADGTATALTVMRTQEVSGYAPWATDGEFASVVADTDNDLWFLVRRDVAGTTELRFEKYEHDKLLDEAIEISQASSTTVGGLTRFNGRDVWAVADNQVFGPITVAGGAIELTQAVTDVRVGTWIAPLATDPPVSLEDESGQRHPRLKRNNRAVISVLDTTSLAIRANDGETVDVPLWKNDEITLDEGPLARPFTGKAEAEGMHGFTEHGKLTVTQLYPGTLTVRSLTKNIVA